MNADQTELNSSLLKTLSNNIPGVIIYQYTYSKNGLGKFTYLSQNAEEITGCSLKEIYANEELLRNIIASSDRLRFKNAEKTSYQNLNILDIEVKGINNTGHYQHIHFKSIPNKQENGDILWNGLLTDISEKKAFENKLKRNLFHLELDNSINKIIYHSKDERSLTKDICKCLVDLGKYKLVWIGVKPEFDDEDQCVKIAAEAGVVGYTKDIHIDLSNKFQGKGPAANSLNTGITNVANNFKLLENFKVWQEKADEYGLAGCVSIALRYRKHVTGNIVIYSDQINSFDEKEVEFLENIARNLSNAVKNIRIRNEKEKTSQLLNERIKELTILQQINKLLLNDKHDKDSLLSSIVNTIPHAFQNDLECEALIKCGDMTYQSLNYKPSKHALKSLIVCTQYPGAYIEVVYPNELKQIEDNHFKKEERFLLNTISEMLEIYFKKEDAYKLLAKSEANMGSIFKNTEIGYLLMDVDLNIRSFNQSMYLEYYLETGKNLEAGRKFIDFVLPEKKANLLWVFNKIKIEKTTFNYETVYTVKDKINHFEINAIPVLDKNEIIGYCISAQNISKRKEMEKSLLNTNANLLTRNKDLEQFAFIVSHNLRAPVANISALNSLLKESNDLIEKGEILEKIDVSTERLESVILDLNEILKVKKNVSEVFEKINFLNLYNMVKKDMSIQIKESGLKLSCDFSKCPEILTNKSYLNSVFFNLISNSIKYTKKDSSPSLHISTDKKNNEINLSFKDQGIGIDLEKHGKQIFGLYKQFNTNSKGKGVGLYMVKNQIESMGGKINVISEPMKGTEFIISVPTFQ